MGCCNSKRAAATAAARGSAGRSGTHTVARAADVRVRYVGADRVRVRGSATGRLYGWAGGDRTLLVDGRDVAALIRSGLFATA